MHQGDDFKQSGTKFCSPGLQICSPGLHKIYFLQSRTTFLLFVVWDYISSFCSLGLHFYFFCSPGLHFYFLQSGTTFLLFVVQDYISTFCSPGLLGHQQNQLGPLLEAPDLFFGCVTLHHHNFTEIFSQIQIFCLNIHCRTFSPPQFSPPANNFSAAGAKGCNLVPQVRLGQDRLG